MRTRLLLMAVMFALVVPMITACGRVGAPTPPAGVPNIYPKAYPSADQH